MVKKNELEPYNDTHITNKLYLLLGEIKKWRIAKSKKSPGTEKGSKFLFEDTIGSMCTLFGNLVCKSALYDN